MCLIAFGPGFPGLGTGGSAAVFLTEAFDTAGGVEDLLFAGVKRMAFGADFDVKRLDHRGLGLEAVATAAGHIDFGVVRVQTVFHF